MSLIGPRRALLSGSAPKPTLALNFLSSATLDPRITFSRASTAYYTNAAGVLTAASSNVPRFDYSPTSIGTPLGLLIEGQATNNAWPSAPTNVNGIWIGSWKGVNGALSLPGVTAPDGSTNAILLTDATGSSIHCAVDDALSSPNGGAAGGTANTAQAYSVWVKQAPGGANTVRALVQSYGTANDLHATVNLVTGAVSGAGASGDGTFVSATSYAWPNGWWQVVLIGTPTAAASPSPNTIATQIQANGGATYAGTGQAQFYFWGKQSVTGGVPSSYIPTTQGSGPVTRAADVPYLTVPSIGTQGTMVVTASVEGTGLTQVLASTASGKYLAYVNSSGNVAITDGTNTATSVGTVTVGAVFKVAASWGPAGLAISLNNATPVANATYSGGFNNSTTIQLGQSGSGANSLFGHIQTQNFYSARYTGAALKGF